VSQRRLSAICVAGYTGEGVRAARHGQLEITSPAGCASAFWKPTAERKASWMYPCDNPSDSGEHGR